MHTHIARSLVLVLAAMAAVACYAAEPLRWKFEAGEKINYEMIQKMDTTMAAGPAGSFETGMEQTMDITWHIDEITPEGNAKTRQHIERVRLKMTMPGGQATEYDSDSDEAPQGVAAMLAPLYDAMTEGEFKVTMSPRGEILEAEAPPKLLEAMKNIPGAANLGDLSTPDGIKQMIMQGAMTLPEGDLKEGETWQTNLEMKTQLGKMEVATTYEYAGTKEVDGQTYEAIKPAPEIKSVADPNAQMQLTMKGQQADGEILFDREQGRLHSSHLEQTMEMEMEIQGQKINTTIDQTVDMKIKDPESSEK
ncbi:MAG: DUF6263 family protein [Pirellulales bacterium]